MRRFWLLAAGLLILPLAGCAHETMPDEAMQAMATGLATNKPEVYWEGLPASYQKDVEGLIRDFAEKMDPEIWNKGLATAKNLVYVLDEKKEFIQQNQMLANYVDAQVAEANWDDAVETLSILIESDASDLEKLKTLDIKEFLSTSGADLMDHLPSLVAITKLKMLDNIMQEYKAAHFNLIERDGDKAMVEIVLPNKDPEKIPMVKVEGKWIPQDMADSWAEDMEQARQALADFNPGQDPEEKQQILASIQMADSYLKLLRSTKTAEDFNAKVGLITMMLAMSGSGSTRAATPLPSTTHKGDDVPPAALKKQSKSDGPRKPGVASPADDLTLDATPNRASPAEYTTPATAAPASK